MAHTIIITQDRSIYQLIQYGTKLEYHSRWDKAHIAICNTCNDDYNDAMFDMAQEGEE